MREAKQELHILFIKLNKEFVNNDKTNTDRLELKRF